MQVYVDVDLATATEAASVARALAATGAGCAVGPRLLTRSGAPIVSVLRSFGPVFADARIGGDGATVAAAARTLAVSGASIVVLGPGTGRAVAARALQAVEPHAATIAVAVVHPEASEDDTDLVTAGAGRGRLVSRVAAALAGSGVSILGLAIDVGVVAQVAPGTDVLVAGVRSIAEAEDAAARGAGGIVLHRDVVDVGDAARSVRPFVEAAASG